jgi:hypothetical protein
VKEWVGADEGALFGAGAQVGERGSRHVAGRADGCGAGVIECELAGGQVL